MINFRYHIVSLIAVFLALALGVVFGSTVVDRAIVDGLRSQIDNVEKHADDQKAENAALRAELDRTEAFVNDLAPFAVRGSLTNRNVALVAMRGANEVVVTGQAELLQTAGARVDGVLWLEEAWNLDDAEQQDELRAILGVDASGRGLRAAGLVALAARLAAGAAVSVPDLLVQLADAGFVTLADVAGGDTPGSATYPGTDALAFVVGGPEAVITSPSFASVLTAALSDLSVPTTVGEIWAETAGGVERGAWLAPVLDDDVLAERVSTLDDVDLVEGRIAAPLVLADRVRGIVGHYGYGARADQPLPEPLATPAAR
ncbi:MAG: copper transporter [Actinobacteria bacterium]|nr:copper transporter [Actinomycetota bacterium]